MEKMLKAGSSHAAILSESPFFNKKDLITTELPILNIAFSGRLDGGLVPGLTILAGESKSYKTMLALYCMKAYLSQYPDSVALVYDSEFSITPEYLAQFNIDSSRIVHIPIEHIEQLKFDITKRIEQIAKGDKVFIMIDSLGSLASKKEMEDALDEKSVSDMTRAKAIRSLLRIITPSLTMKDIPCLVINHIYQTMELYSKNIVGGGTAVMYSANQVFIISKAQEKDAAGVLSGWNFTINIEKSRFVREKSKLAFQVLYGRGINKWSGLLNIALEGKFIVKPKMGWYCKIDPDTGEVEGKNYREKELNTKEFWQPLLENEAFKAFVIKRYSLSNEEETDEEIKEHFTEDVD